ncbi:substrate-binding domain-containing protein [Actinosynnema sp. NPDC004786]
MGPQPQHAVHRTVVVVDVSAFSRRSLIPQGAIRRGLYAALAAAFEDCGLDWSAAYHEDRGDGVLVLVPPDVPKSRVADGLVHALHGELRRYNATRTEDALMRLRMAITAGEVQHDDEGVVGEAVTLAFRLLDSRPLRDALERSTGLFALIVSDRFYADVVEPDPAMDPGSFRRVDVEVKEVRGHAWLHLPNAAAPEPAPPPPPAPPDRAPRPRLPKPRLAPLLLVLPLLVVGVTNAAGSAPAAVPPCPPPVQLNVLVSDELEEVVRSLALAFEDTTGPHNELQCKELNALVFSGPSTDQRAAQALGQGWATGDLTAVGPEPHVWLPDSDAEVRAVEARLRDRTDVRLRPRDSVAVSPVVLGASEELAGRIAPDGDFRWDYSGRHASVDPSSGVGVLAAAALAHGRLGGLDLDAADVPRRLHEITRASTADEPCVGDVTVVGSEKAVADTEGCRVLYPADGTLQLNHPFVEIERPERPRNERRQRIVDRFLEYLRSDQAQEQFRRARFRDVAWNVGADPGLGVRPGRPRLLPVVPDATAVRAAWERASRARVIGLVGDGSADANTFLRQVALLAGPEDRVVPDLPLSEGLAEEAVARGVHVVVLAARTPVPAIARAMSGPVHVVAVGFTDGACAPSTALHAVAEAHGGTCHQIVDRNVPGPSQRQGEALDDVARAAWGG